MSKHNGSPRFNGRKLAAVIREQGRRQDWLAARAGISEALLSRLLRGERNVSEDVARRLAYALDVPFFVAFDLSVESESLSHEAVPA
jgi:transcriptional regulator with XRE-family HTH domain